MAFLRERGAIGSKLHAFSGVDRLLEALGVGLVWVSACTAYAIDAAA